MSEAERILGLIADPDRLRVVAALALGASTPSEVVDATNLERKVVEKGLARLVAGELVEVSDGSYRLLTEDMIKAVRTAAEARPADVVEGAPEVLNRFVKDGRLRSLPTTKSKRAVVLDYLCQMFEPGKHYPEKQVNALLSRWHEDVAMLRRYLVDEGFLDRRSGTYWRAGGTYPLD